MNTEVFNFLTIKKGKFFFSLYLSLDMIDEQLEHYKCRFPAINKRIRFLNWPAKLTLIHEKYIAITLRETIS